MPIDTPRFRWTLRAVIRAVLFFPYLACYGAVAAAAAYIALIVSVPHDWFSQGVGGAIAWTTLIGAFLFGAYYAWRVVHNRLLHVALLAIGLTHVVQGVVEGQRRFALAEAVSPNDGLFAGLAHSIAGTLLIFWAMLGGIAALGGACGWILSLMSKQRSVP